MAMMSPFMPAHVLFLETCDEINLLQLLAKVKNELLPHHEPTWDFHLQAELANDRAKIYSGKALLCELRTNENSTEHFTQLIVLSLIIAMSRTSSPIMAGFNKVFIEEGSTLVIISALISVWSLVWGPIAHLSSLKNGFLGMIATLIIIPYFAIGAFTRLFMFLMLFTPVLGIFDTTHHYIKGKILIYPSLDSIIYEPESNTSYFQLWEDKYRFHVRHYNEFLTMPSNVTIGISMGIIVLHLVASFMLVRPLYRKSGDGIVRQFMRGIYTFVNPPLFCDWEELYRLSDYKTSIPESWNQSKKLFSMFQVLFMVEHTLLLIPMIWLRVCIKKRSAFLEEGPFKEVPDELLSTNNVNILLTIGVVATFGAPLLQAALAYAYFRFGHPWARILKAEVFSSQQTSSLPKCMLPKWSWLTGSCPKCSMPTWPWPTWCWLRWTMSTWYWLKRNSTSSDIENKKQNSQAHELQPSTLTETVQKSPTIESTEKESHAPKSTEVEPPESDSQELESQ